MTKRTRAHAPRRVNGRVGDNAQPAGYEASCRALLALVAPGVRDDTRALEIARKAVAEAIGPGLVVEPLGPGARDYRIARADAQPFAPGEAWVLTRALLAHRDVADAEPAIEQPGLEPPSIDVHPDMPQALAASPAGPLPCAAHPEWSLDLCRVREAWQLVPPTPHGRVQGESIRVGHPDTGYTPHAEIFDTPSRVIVADGFDFVARAPDPRDPLVPGNPGHGTTTASVIMSSVGGPGAEFVSGIAPLATLEIKTEGPLKGYKFDLHAALTNIGRGEHNDIAIRDESISDSHAKIQKRADGWYVVDQGSTNGTYVGGRRVQGEQRIEGAPDLRFGNLKMTFRPAVQATGEGGSTRAIAAVDIESLRRAQPAKTPAMASAPAASTPEAGKKAGCGAVIAFFVTLAGAGAGFLALLLTTPG